MPTFGHKLRYERESRNTRIQELSARTHIGLRYLEALENNDFDALPGPRGFGKLYIRAYAEVLGFDPKSLIEAFEQERRKRARIDDDEPARKQPRIRRIRYVPPPLRPVEPEPAPAAIAEPVMEAEPVVVSAPEPAKRRGGWTLVAAPVVVTLLIVAIVALRDGPTDPVINTAPPDTAETTPANERPADPVAEPSVEAPPRVAIPEGLRVTESGVGRGVVDRRLVGAGTRFEEGSTVFFFSRVLGGAPGQKLHHVWLHEGRVIQSIELPVGSANWRTYSNKTLWVRGSWTVEARDADDRVLARADFSCEAP